MGGNNNMTWLLTMVQCHWKRYRIKRFIVRTEVLKTKSVQMIQDIEQRLQILGVRRMKKTFYKGCYDRLKRDIRLALYPAQSTKKNRVLSPCSLDSANDRPWSVAGTKYPSSMSLKARVKGGFEALKQEYRSFLENIPKPSPETT